MKLKSSVIFSVLMIIFTAGYAHSDPPTTTNPPTVSGPSDPSNSDLYDATLEAFKSDNPKLLSDYGAIRVRMGKEKGVETQVKTKNNGVFNFKCHRHKSSDPFECHEAEIEP